MSKSTSIRPLLPLMTSLQESLVVEELGGRGFTCIDNFLSIEELLMIRNYIFDLHEKHFLRSAAIGKDAEEQIVKEIRSDLIKWIDFSTPGPVNDFFLPKLEEIITLLKQKCFLGIRDFESHFTFYPPGSYYKKHLDRFKGNNNRLVSFVCYLNDFWLPEHGGQLRIYDKESVADIEPLGGRIVLFLSDEIEHEVLETKKERISITGWMLQKEMNIGFINNV